MKIFTDKFGHRYEIIEELTETWAKGYWIGESGIRLRSEPDYIFTGETILESDESVVNRKRLGW